MTSIRVTHGIDDLASDMAAIPPRAIKDLAGVVRRDATEGNKIARAFAKESAGSHGVHYPKSMSAEMVTPLSWEYGPDASMMQGGMSFEFGSRNQKPHLDLAKSADIIGPKLAHDVGEAIDGWFW